MSTHEGTTPTAPKAMPKMLSYDEYLARSREAEAKRAAEREMNERAQIESLAAQGVISPEVAKSVVSAMSEKQAAPKAPPAAVEAEVSEPHENELLDHNYDGIQEYDNPTPGWWYMIFNGTIVFSVLYVLVYHFSPGVSTEVERLVAAENALLERQFAELNELPAGEEKLVRIMAEPKWLEGGAAIYSQSCALCHGESGEGLIGPNLTDEVYLNIASLGGMTDIIANGAGNGAMPAQKNILNENEIAIVGAYVASLRGQNLEGPRGPEGAPIPAWPTLDAQGNFVPSPTP